MLSDDEIVMISAGEHYSYCPRQCALIHVERIFDEDVFALRGQRDHERVDFVGYEVDGETLTERALPLWSEEWGLIGRADAVEFWADGMMRPVFGPDED